MIHEYRGGSRGTKKIPHAQNFSVAAARPNFALYHQKMNRTTINQAPRTLSEDREGHGHYFTPGAAQFCERMGIEYVKRGVFRTFNVSMVGEPFNRCDFRNFNHQLASLITFEQPHMNLHNRVLSSRLMSSLERRTRRFLI